MGNVWPYFFFTPDGQAAGCGAGDARHDGRYVQDGHTKTSCGPPDINIFNFYARGKSTIPHLSFTTYRIGNNYMACRNGYMASKKSCHRDSFSEQRTFLYEKRTVSRRPLTSVLQR